MKFRVGDRVKFIKSTTCHSNDVQIGEVYKIIKIDSSNVPYQVENREWFEEDELELVTFTKSDLKDGDKCTLKNGEVLFYGGSSKYERTYCFENLTDDFKFKLNDEVSIVKVERPTKYETVFERKEEILDETEKRYLKQVIRPFRDRIKSVAKIEYINRGEIVNYIRFNLYTRDWSSLPNFKRETMYKGMELNKQYTLEELGL